MIQRLLVSLLLLAGAAGAQASGYIRLDGRYYAVGNTSTMQVDTQLGTITMPSAQMVNCVRSGGGAMMAGPLSLNYGTGGAKVPLVSNEIIVSGVADNQVVMNLTSTTGDVLCNGQVVSPIAIFDSSFE